MMMTRFLGTCSLAEREEHGGSTVSDFVYDGVFTVYKLLFGWCMQQGCFAMAPGSVVQGPYVWALFYLRKSWDSLTV
jgi:hypothetical protein